MIFAVFARLTAAGRTLCSACHRQRPRGLTPDELEHYNSHGYVIVKGILKDEDFRTLERDYTGLIDIKVAPRACCCCCSVRAWIAPALSFWLVFSRSVRR